MAITTSAPYGAELEYMPLEAFGGVGGFKLKPIPGSLQLHGGGGKALGFVVGAAAVIAAPYLAGAVVSSMVASGAIASTLAATAVGIGTGALVGGAGAALGAAISGGNVGQSALFGAVGGAVGGGFGGYSAAPAATTASGTTAPLGTVQSAQAAQAAPAAGVVPPAAPTTTGFAGTGIQGVGDITSQVAAGAPQTFAAPIPTGAPGGIGSQLSGVTAAPGTGIGGTNIPSVMAQQPNITRAALIGAAGAGTAATGLGPTVAAAQAGQLATAPTAAATSGNWASQFGTALASRVTDPNAMADITLRAAGQLAGSALAGSGLSPEQQELVDMQMAELQQLREQNQAAFNQRLEAAQALLGEARYFDPEYFGLQRARQQQIAGAQAQRAGVRGLTGEQRRAEARRFDIATARDVGTAYDQGYLTGIQGRLQTQQAGLAALPMPSQFTATSAYGAMAPTLSAAERQRMEQAQAIGGLFGGLTGYSQSRSTG